MRCNRCQGLMVFDRFLDVCGEMGRLWFRGWRCLSCGEIVDPVILSNRRTAPPRVRATRLHRVVTVVG
jgi:hypothetical protein